MKKLIITLALVALASTAWAQRQPQEITLPQYLPPSYHSPHGGTGYADTIIQPTPPVTLPSDPHPAMTMPNHGRAGRGPDSAENDQLQHQVNEACKDSSSEACSAANKKHMDFLDRRARAIQKQHIDTLNAIGRPR